VSDGYEFDNPNDHVFVPVKAQTGCARCGFARGHHPTAAQLRAQLAHPLTPRESFPCWRVILLAGDGLPVRCGREHGHDGACMACSDLVPN
jgi:hypothetical protein